MNDLRLFYFEKKAAISNGLNLIFEKQATAKLHAASAGLGGGLGALFGALRRTGAGESSGRSIMRSARTGALTGLGTTAAGEMYLRGLSHLPDEVIDELADPVVANSLGISALSLGASIGHNIGKRLSTAGRKVDADRFMSEKARQAKEEAERKLKELRREKAKNVAKGVAGAAAVGGGAYAAKKTYDRKNEKRASIPKSLQKKMQALEGTSAFLGSAALTGMGANAMEKKITKRRNEKKMKELFGDYNE